MTSKAQKDRKKNARKTQVHTPKPLEKEKYVGTRGWFEQQVAELERHGDRSAEEIFSSWKAKNSGWWKKYGTSDP